MVQNVNLLQSLLLILCLNMKTNYLQVYLDNCAYYIVNKQMMYYLDDNLFENYKF